MYTLISRAITATPLTTLVSLFLGAVRYLITGYAEGNILQNANRIGNAVTANNLIPAGVRVR